MCWECSEVVFTPGFATWALGRTRMYRVYFDKSKYVWRGPSLQQTLRVCCPLQDLRMNANDMYWMKPSELVLWICLLCSCVCVFLCFVAIIVLAFVCFDHRSMLWAGLISLSWAFPSLHSSSRKAMRHIIPTDWCGTFALKSFLI